MKKNIINSIVVLTLTISLVSGCSRIEDTLLLPEQSSNGELENDRSDVGEEVYDNADQEAKDQSEDNINGNDAVIDVIDDKPEPTNQGITVNLIKYEIVDFNLLEEQLRIRIDSLKQQRGYEYWLQDDGTYLILISSGEKINGGFNIKIEAVEDNEGKTIIYVVESEPAKASMNMQVISYPHVIIKASGITDQFIVTNQSNTAFSRLSVIDLINDVDNNSTILRLDQSIDYSKPVVGIYQGLIDNNTLEVLVDDVVMSFSADDINQYLKGIEVDDSIGITITVSPSDQLIVEGIVKME